MNKTYEVSNRYHDYKDYTREYTEVGRSIPRLDGPMKVTGKLQYTDDIKLPRMVYAKILRSPHAHAIIKNIDFIFRNIWPQCFEHNNHVFNNIFNSNLCIIHHFFRFFFISVC